MTWKLCASVIALNSKNNNNTTHTKKLKDFAKDSFVWKLLLLSFKNKMKQNIELWTGLW